MLKEKKKSLGEKVLEGVGRKGWKWWNYILIKNIFLKRHLNLTLLSREPCYKFKQKCDIFRFRMIMGRPLQTTRQRNDEILDRGDGVGEEKRKDDLNVTSTI